MNKRLKKELRGEWRRGREGHREREREIGEREREGEEEEVQKSLTDVAHAIQRASTVCIVRRSPSPLFLCPHLPNSLTLPSPPCTTIPIYH